MSGDSLEQWSAIAEAYHHFRPPVPEALVAFLSSLFTNHPLERVVDLGAGTGLSTQAWSAHAQEVIGVEPSFAMLKTARKYNLQDTVQFIQTYAHETGLEQDSADLVCAGSALHWMEPLSLLQEVSRLLKPGGIFSFWGTSHPPVTPFLAIDHAYEVLMSQPGMKVGEQLPMWKWSDFNTLLTARSDFGAQRYFYMHQELLWEAWDYLQWLGTSPHFLAAQKKTHLAPLCEDFKMQMTQAFGSKAHTCLFVYQVQVYPYLGEK